MKKYSKVLILILFLLTSNVGFVNATSDDNATCCKYITNGKTGYKWINSNVFTIIAVISIGLIFISCGIIELCRSKIFEKFRVNYIMCSLVEKIKSKVICFIKKLAT